MFSFTFTKRNKNYIKRQFIERKFIESIYNDEVIQGYFELIINVIENFINISVDYFVCLLYFEYKVTIT